MTGNDVIRSCEGLPNPLTHLGNSVQPCVVQITVGAIAHIAERHLANDREPWRQWLAPEQVDRLIGSCEHDSFSELDPGLLDEVARAFEAAIRATFERPLVLHYRGHRSQSSSENPGRECWVLPAPQGALLILRPRRQALITAYFPSVACREQRPDRRWRATVGALIRRYAVLRPGLGIVPPGPSDQTEIRDLEGRVREVRTQVEFITPASWGFRPDLHGTPWRGRLGEWTPVPSPSPRQRRHRLNPRRQERIEEDHG